MRIKLFESFKSEIGDIKKEFDTKLKSIEESYIQKIEDILISLTDNYDMIVKMYKNPNYDPYIECKFEVNIHPYAEGLSDDLARIEKEISRFLNKIEIKNEMRLSVLYRGTVDNHIHQGDLIDKKLIDNLSTDILETIRNGSARSGYLIFKLNIYDIKFK